MAKGKRGARGDEKAARPKPNAPVPVADWPAWRIERKPIEWLKPHPRNARLHPVGQLTELDLSFAEHGAVTPFVANLNGEILRGHGGSESVSHLHGRGIEVPVVVVDWPEEKQIEYMVRDNATAERSSWDAPKLGVQVADLSKLRGIAAAQLHIGLTPALLKKIAPEQNTPGQTDGDAAAPAAPAAPVSRLGDVWHLGRHRLMCGDATKADHVTTLLAGDRPHLMVTDPPYGVDYDPEWRNYVEEELGASASSTAFSGGARALGLVQNDSTIDWNAVWSLFPGEVCYVWHASFYSPEVCASLEAVGFERRNQIIWAKNKHAISRGHYHYRHEPCWYMVRKGSNASWQGSRSENTVWDIASHGGGDASKKDFATGHSTQKPIECMARPMRNNSKPGDFIYDPFCGSGTTLVAAEGLARRGLCMEIAPAYCDVSILRWESFTGERARFAAGGAEWKAVAAERGVALAA